jgi:TRAP-type C4-dicarboxylate transport system permease small subunit
MSLWLIVLLKGYRGIFLFWWAIVVACHIAMVIYIPADIAGRSLFGSGIPGCVEIGEFMMILVGFLGMAQAQKMGSHVDVDLLFNRLPNRVKDFLRVVILILMISFVSLFFYATLMAALDYTINGEDAWFGPYLIPVWIIRWTAPIGLALFIIQLIAELVAYRKSIMLK